MRDRGDREKDSRHKSRISTPFASNVGNEKIGLAFDCFVSLYFGGWRGVDEFLWLLVTMIEGVGAALHKRYSDVGELARVLNGLIPIS